MRALGILTWVLVTSVLSVIVQAVAFRQLWTWFVAYEYGVGPSLGAWFGIATILRLMLKLSELDPTPRNVEPWNAERSTKQVIFQWIGIVMVLGSAWSIGSVLGWVR